MYYVAVNKRVTQKNKKGGTFMKKLLSLLLALTVIFTLSLTAFAADITKADAEAIALKDAGYTERHVLYLRSQTDYDDGRTEYEVEFAVNNADGSYVEYDYEISADGRIISKDVDVERGNGFENHFENRFENLFRQLINWFLNLFR